MKNLFQNKFKENENNFNEYSNLEKNNKKET
jgi:hypothetical protein